MHSCLTHILPENEAGPFVLSIVLQLKRVNIANCLDHIVLFENFPLVQCFTSKQK